MRVVQSEVQDSEGKGNSPAELRSVVRCENCSLVQYETANQVCRRCRQGLKNLEPFLLKEKMSLSVGSHKRLGTVAYALRKWRGWSQEEAAKRIHSTHGFLSRIEIGKQIPSLVYCEKFCGVFEISMKTLFSVASSPLAMEPFSLGLFLETRELDADKKKAIVRILRHFSEKQK